MSTVPPVDDPREPLFDDVGLIVAAAGESRRFGGHLNKLLVALEDVPVVCHCLRNFASVVPPEMTVLVVPAEAQQQFRRALATHGIPDTVGIVTGANTRQESVWRGLQALPSAAAFAVVHDAARPFCPADLLRKCIASARLRGSGVAATPVTDTIKVAEPNGRVLRTPERARLWAAETPQVFEISLLRDAYTHVRRQNQQVTDDAQAVECYGEAVYLVPHKILNRKITYPWEVAGGFSEVGQAESGTIPELPP